MPTGRLTPPPSVTHVWAVGTAILVLTTLPLFAQRGGGAAAPPAPILGDAAKGKALVESTKCLDCHRIGETGSRLGPDLSGVGTLRSPDLLRRALVMPDADVSPENRFVRVVTRDGVTIVGRLLNQDAFSIQLMNAEQQLKSYSKAALREHTIMDKGLMPSSEGKLTDTEITDIVSYLQSLKGVPQ